MLIYIIMQSNSNIKKDRQSNELTISNSICFGRQIHKDVFVLHTRRHHFSEFVHLS